MRLRLATVKFSPADARPWGRVEEEREILRRREDNIHSGERRPSEADSEKPLRGSIDNGQKKTEVPNAEQANEANTE